MLFHWFFFQAAVQGEGQPVSRCRKSCRDIAGMVMDRNIANSTRKEKGVSHSAGKFNGLEKQLPS
jgi:hypothetical protein